MTRLAVLVVELDLPDDAETLTITAHRVASTLDGLPIRRMWAGIDDVAAAVAAAHHDTQAGTVDGIRPHTPMTPDQLDLASRLIEQTRPDPEQVRQLRDTIAPGVFDSQIGRTVPLTAGQGGPTIGQARIVRGPDGEIRIEGEIT